MKKKIVLFLCIPFIPFLALIGWGLSREGGERLSYRECITEIWRQWWEC